MSAKLWPFAVGIVVWFAFTIFTAMYLFRQSTDPERERERRFARFWTVFMTVGFGLIGPEVVPLGPPYWAEAGYIAFIAFPIAAWVGIAMSAVMAARLFPPRDGR